MTVWRNLARANRAIWLVALLVFGGDAVAGWLYGSEAGAAFADDDDGDDDDDDDGGGSSSSSVGSGAATSGDGVTVRRVRPPQGQRRGTRASGPARPAARVDSPPPAAAPREIVVTNLSDGDAALLVSEGFTVIEKTDLADVAVVLYRLRTPDGLTLEAARSRVRALPTGATGDFNHFYRTQQDALSPASAPAAVPVPGPALCAHLNCGALDLIGWPTARAGVPQCRVSVPVGMIDTGVNARHDSLIGADIEVVRLTPDAVDPSGAVHGTAVAALLVGQMADRVPGLIAEARLVAVDIFGRAAGDERASVATLIRGLDALGQRDVRVINLSLAGPPNAALEAALLHLATADPGVIVLAAAGNGGPGAEVAYPAGYASVLAVTAVDRRGQIYRRAQRGPHLDLAAPGVDVWSATSIKGVKPRTGTSFAVPFATAAAAVLVSRDPLATPAAVSAQLRTLVRDIGAAGPDEVFGAGLLALGSLCQPGIFGGSVE